MTRYFIGAVAAAALALAGCNDHHAGQGYSGNQKQENGNDSAYQHGYDTNSNLHNDGNGSNTSVSGVSGNGDTAHQSDFNNQKDSDENAATGQGLSGNEQNPANTPKGQLMSINGTVKDAGGGGLTLVTGSKGEIKLDTGDFTKIVGVNGRAVKSSDIKEGSEVRAAYKFDGKSNKAMTITITRTPMSNAADQGTLHRTDDQQKQEQNAADPSKNR